MAWCIMGMGQDLAPSASNPGYITVNILGKIFATVNTLPKYRLWFVRPIEPFTSTAAYSSVPHSTDCMWHVLHAS
jgi:hypothetical protein